MATCLVHRRASAAMRFIQATTADEIQKLQPGLFRELTCLNLPGISDYAEARSVRASTDVERGMIAEALLTQMSSVPLPPPLPLQHEYHSDWTAVSGRSPLVEEMGVCMAATNPAAIQILLRTTPESAGEQAALQTVIPALGPCLQSNARLTANRQSLRAVLAEALYHRMTAPQAQTAVVTK